MKNQLSKVITSSIENGLKNAKLANNEHDKYNNASPHKRNDCVFNELDHSIKNFSQEEVDIYTFNRICYKFPIIYDRSNKTLYSIISRSRYNDLMKEYAKDSNNPHYFFAFLTANSRYQPEMKQLTIFDTDINEEIKDKQNKIISNVKEIIDEKSPISYYAVVYNQKNYQLMNIQAIMLTHKAELVEIDNWSKYIGVDYDYSDDIIAVDANYEEPVTLMLKNKNIDVSVKKIASEKEIK